MSYLDTMTINTLFNMNNKIKELESTINELKNKTNENEINYNKQSRQIEIQNVKLYKQNEQLIETLNNTELINKIDKLENIINKIINKKDVPNKSHDIKQYNELSDNDLYKELCIGYNNGYLYKDFMYDSNTDQIDYTRIADIKTFVHTCPSVYIKFKNLKKIIVNKYFMVSNSFLDSNLLYLSTVLELHIHHYDIIANKGSYLTNLKSLPSLEKICYYNYNKKGVISFELIKNIPNLKYLIYSNCLSIIQLDEITKYCKSRNIKLEILH